MKRWITKKFPFNYSLAGLVFTIIVAGFFFAFMEWLFMVTKPSFMDTLSISKRIQVLIFSGSFIGCLILFCLLPLLIISRLPWKRSRNLLTFLIPVFSLLPSVVFASGFLLWLDNFTYTVFQYGIVTSTGIERVIYALIFLFFIGIGYWIVQYLARKFINIAGRQKIKEIVLALSVLTLLLIAIIPSLIHGKQSQNVVAATTNKRGTLPNILVITSDGLGANYMSLYGYERDTTPNISKLARTSLVAENAFANSGGTAGSTISIYTGKYPSTTRVLYPPNILQGVDSYQHLPGLLRSLGYRTVQISNTHHVDAYTLNLQNGFEEANGRAIESSYVSVINQFLPHNFSFFLYDTSNRVIDRLRHIFFIKRMVNPNDIVVKPADRQVDQEKLNILFEEIDNQNKPLFVHLHFMVTHGPLFDPSERVFSKGKITQEPWDADYYDDSVLDFDRYIKRLVDGLIERDLLEDTIIIIGSDHDRSYVPYNRIPLIVRFPEGRYAGRISTSVQNLDIAPTILDYLDIEIPKWMVGQSILQDEMDQRPIFGFNVQNAKDGKILTDQIKPPFYQFGYITVMNCQQYFFLRLEDPVLKKGNVEGYVDPCHEAELVNETQAIYWIIDHLEENGFETMDLEVSLRAKDMLP